MTVEGNKFVNHTDCLYDFKEVCLKVDPTLEAVFELFNLAKDTLKEEILCKILKFTLNALTKCYCGVII